MQLPTDGTNMNVCATQVLPMGSDDRSLCIQISRERSYPLPIYWYHSTVVI